MLLKFSKNIFGVLDAILLLQQCFLVCAGLYTMNWYAFSGKVTKLGRIIKSWSQTTLAGYSYWGLRFQSEARKNLLYVLLFQFDKTAAWKWAYSLFSNFMCSSVPLHVCMGKWVFCLVACTTNYKTIVSIMNSIKICIIYHLREARFHDDCWGGN